MLSTVQFWGWVFMGVIIGYYGLGLLCALWTCRHVFALAYLLIPKCQETTISSQQLDQSRAYFLFGKP